MTFQDNGTELEYRLKISEGTVHEEELIVDGSRKLHRQENGRGTIDAVDMPGKPMRFEVPTSEPAVLTKRDLVQHPFLEPLYLWSTSVLYYPFGTPMGRDHLEIVQEDGATKVDASDFQAVIGIFREGAKQFPTQFESEVVADMKHIGYDLMGVGLGQVPHVLMKRPFPSAIVGLYAQEADLRGKTWQTTMSQGMFRALSLIIQTVYAELMSNSGCLIIDDIGEGLDHDRSTRLIQVLMDRAQKSHVQLIMATNDRFVMNAVPLESWSCLRRTPGGCKVLNHQNSKLLFDEFRLTGLNNFDFLATQFLSTEHHDDD
ncbi:MAG: ATP-binding protein [Planctomycetes bacterium]|nr:ATP-binding protein [Planctomycetota bacterium]